MKKRVFTLILAAALLAAAGAACASPSEAPLEPTPSAEPSPAPETPSPAPTETGDKYMMSDMTVVEFVDGMGLGINLGNTMEACGDWINKSDIRNYETAWGSVVITEEVIAGYAAAGFGSLRIPVAWSNMMEEGYVIHEPLLDRVEEIVNWTLDNGMTAVVNIHWDGGWWERFPEETDECMKKYTAIWTQISERFKRYGDGLMFESLNEELSFNGVWNRYGGTKGKDEAYALANSINQTFVDTVRGSGGNNERRFLLIAGYSTDIELTCDPLFAMPSDPRDRCAVSVHYYTPSTFAILSEDASWGKARDTWGTDADIAELNRNMDLMKTTFVDKGIPVIVGEYGVERKNKTPEMARLYITSVCEAVYARGMCPMLWDTPGGFYDRVICGFPDTELAGAFKEIGELR